MLFNPSGLLFISHFLMLFLLFLRLFSLFSLPFFSCCLLHLESCRGVVSPSLWLLLFVFSVSCVCVGYMCSVTVVAVGLSLPPFSFFYLLKSFCLERIAKPAQLFVSRPTTTGQLSGIRRAEPISSSKIRQEKISFLLFLFFLFLFLFHPHPKWIEKENWKNK